MAKITATKIIENELKVLGEKVYSEIVHASHTLITPKLNSGIYLVKVSSEKSELSEKLVIE